MPANTLNGVPMIDILPLRPDTTVLVNDTISPSGRFVQYLAAKQTLQDEGRCYWLCCGPETDTLIAKGLKRLDCMAATTYLQKRDCALKIETVFDKIEEMDTGEEEIVKSLYTNVKSWCDKVGSYNSRLIIIDELSCLSDIVGRKLAYALVYSLVSYCKRNKNCSLVIHVTGPLSDEATTNEDKNEVVLQNHLAELVDTIIDITPLTTGYTRDAHGRLTWTENASTDCGAVNFCCYDNTVQAIRLQNS